jgi:hypothetical protein
MHCAADLLGNRLKRPTMQFFDSLGNESLGVVCIFTLKHVELKMVFVRDWIDLNDGLYLYH